LFAADRLSRRVAELDGESGYFAHPDGDLAQFIWVIETVVHTYEPLDLATNTLAAEDADELLRRSRLLDRLSRDLPQLTDGPLDRFAQHWVATGKPPGRATQVNYTPQESCFIPVARVTHPITGAKPFYVGLFTSTAVAGSGMWRYYLRRYEDSSFLHLRPWYTWHLQPRHEARIYEIRDATAWVRLITTHPRVEAGFVHPDWLTISEHWDAVHITLRVIAAAQGIFFTTALGPTPAPYWDVESTFWLNWCFTASTFIEEE